MMDVIKKTVLAGLGATLTSIDKMEEVLNEYVEKGRLSKEEAKEMAASISEKSKKEFEAVRSDLSEKVDPLLDKLNLVTRKEYDALLQRVSDLEDKLSSDKEA